MPRTSGERVPIMLFSANIIHLVTCHCYAFGVRLLASTAGCQIKNHHLACSHRLKSPKFLGEKNRRTPMLAQSQSQSTLLLRREPLRPGEGVRVSAAAPESDFCNEADADTAEHEKALHNHRFQACLRLEAPEGRWCSRAAWKDPGRATWECHLPRAKLLQNVPVLLSLGRGGANRRCGCDSIPAPVKQTLPTIAVQCTSKQCKQPNRRDRTNKRAHAAYRPFRRDVRHSHGKYPQLLM